MAIRVYIPATTRCLPALLRDGSITLTSARACAVTPQLRKLYADSDADDEVLSFYAFDDATFIASHMVGEVLAADVAGESATIGDAASVSSITCENPSRYGRVVLACDIEDALVDLVPYSVDSAMANPSEVLLLVDERTATQSPSSSPADADVPGARPVISCRAVASIHVDLAEDGADVQQACRRLVSSVSSDDEAGSLAALNELNKHPLAWYDPTELGDLVSTIES